MRERNPERQGRHGPAAGDLWQRVQADRDAGSCRVLQYADQGLEPHADQRYTLPAEQRGTHAASCSWTDLDEAGWDAFMEAASRGLMPPLSEIEGASYTRPGDICPKTCRECGPNTLTCKDGDISQLQLHHPVNQ